MKVPVFNLTRAADAVADEVRQNWSRLLDQAAFIGGEEVSKFEESFADYLGVAGCVGVANGTDALIVALRALDLKPGDEVIVPAYSFIATAACVEWMGGRPVFADVEAETLNIDVASVAERVTERTVGLIGVHLYGRPFDIDAMTALCRDRGLWFLEDAAQAHGAEWNGTKVGGFGRLATWSFYPTKNLGAFGDAGAVTGSDPELLARVRRIANHGRLEHYLHAEIGTNSRLDGLQAAALNARLPRLDSGNERRREIAARYRKELGDLEGLTFLRDDPGAVAVYHQATVLTERQESLREFLGAQGIGTALHYPVALHDQPAFAVHRGGDLPVAEAATNRVVCLPMFPELTESEVELVCGAIQEFFATVSS